ncbi:DgyrCDS7945 [Dimorphilus gyrociliatus]|uniref:DgyrCDS7945 n=1 Tax=Dimorphilus gyrociliatus TaxID=2664684 RepID=A0A7I8VSQ3_9ANNE|nr:DgyrCDS7945 [Dimorphilus gyrociliatus]
MKLNFELQNVLGAVYRKGDLLFATDGVTLLAPVGNRLNRMNLQKHISRSIDTKLELNISVLCLSPDNSMLLIIDEEGSCVILHAVSHTLLHTHRFNGQVYCAKFSPDSRKLAVANDSNVLVFDSPAKTRTLNAFSQQRILYGAQDHVVHLDWSTDSRVLLASSKDMNTRLYAACDARLKQLVIHSLASQNDCIVASYFEPSSLDCFNIGKNGVICVWQCDTALSDLEEKNENDNDEEDQPEKLKYRRVGKYNYKDSLESGRVRVTCAVYHKDTHILVTGFDSGTFTVHEMPDFKLMHSLNIKEAGPITSLAFNNTGDWIALGAGEKGQLIVWEWRSESYILKQAGHFLAGTTSVAWTPDGVYITTGGDDGKVKVWTVGSGHCYATFDEHSSVVTGVSTAKNVIVSSSLDGSVRAFDLHRFRNFRTFTTPEPVQFSCVDIDSSAELVCAGCNDNFDVFLWSVQTGRLLDTLSGHEAPVCSIEFKPGGVTLATGSWDKKTKLWGVTEDFRETIDIGNEVTAIAWKLDGSQLAVADLNAKITFWAAAEAEQEGNIDGKPYLGYARSKTDKISGKKGADSKIFTSLVYSADGSLLLAAGNSPNICLFHVEQEVLVKTFIVTKNRSLDTLNEFLDRRKMTEWGSLALVEKNDEGNDVSLKLPGVRKGDFSGRRASPDVRISQVSWSNTGRQFVAASTDGIMVFSLDQDKNFNPIDLEIEITPNKVFESLKSKDYFAALTYALKLRESSIIRETIENVPVPNIDVIIQQLTIDRVEDLIRWITAEIEKTKHVHFYVLWCKKLLFKHGQTLKSVIGSKTGGETLSIDRDLNRALKSLWNKLSPIVNHNRHLFDYILNCKKENSNTDKVAEREEKMDDSDNEDDDDEDEEILMSEVC